MDTLAAKQAFNDGCGGREVLVFFYHDPSVAAGYIREENGNRRVIPA
jgi:hypothetical protein